MTQWRWNTPSMTSSLQATTLQSNYGSSRIAVWCQAGTPSTWNAGSTTTTPARYRGCIHAHSGGRTAVNEQIPISNSDQPSSLKSGYKSSSVGVWQVFFPSKVWGKGGLFTLLCSPYRRCLNPPDHKIRKLPFRGTPRRKTSSCCPKMTKSVSCTCKIRWSVVCIPVINEESQL